MVAENARDTLIRISQFIIRKESTDFAKNCQNMLIKAALCNAGNVGLDVSTIIKEIEKQMGLKNFPIIIVRETIERLIQKGEVYEKDKKFYLEKEEFEKMRKAIEERKEDLNFIESTIKSKMLKKGVIENEKISLALEILYKFLAKWFVFETSFATNLLLPKKDFKKLEVVPLEALDETLKEITDADLKQIIRSCIIEAFTESEKIMNFIYKTLQSYLHLELLNADPECRCLQKASFSNITFILDTNVLMALLLKADPMHEGINEVLSIAHDLGIKIVFTKRTKQEWLWSLERANEEFRDIVDARATLLPELENVFIRSYFKEKEANSSLTWQGFYLQMRGLESILKKSGVEYWYKKEHDLDKLQNKELFDPLNGMVYYCAKKKGNIKSKEVCEHDAYHILLVRELRGKTFTSIFGPSCWFLTCDTSLICADEKLNHFMRDPFAPPSSLIADIWVTVVAPFLGPEVPETKLASAFSYLMKTHFATMPTGLSADQVIEALGHWLPYKSLTDEDIKAILSDAIVAKYYNELREAQIWDPNKVEELREKLREKVDEKVYQIFDEKVANAERRREEAEKRALQREQELTAEKKQRMLIFRLCAILGTIYALFGLALIGTGNLTSGVISILSSIVFTVIALTFKYIKIKAGPLEIEAKDS